MSFDFDAAVMHDYFVDRFVHARRLIRLISSVGAKARAGGGGIHGVRQEDVPGGNAVNLARALATLGAKTLLITHSDHEHRPLLLGRFSGLPAEVRVKPLPAGLTVALEGESNVMLGDAGGAGAFGPSALTGSDWRSLRRSRVVCAVNWSANSMGTELLLALRKRLGSGRTIFVDPADFRDAVPAYRRMLRLAKRTGLFDWLSLNEEEAMATARLLGSAARSPGQACLAVSRALRVRVDVHSSGSAFSSNGTWLVARRASRVRPRRLTGAGDVWDAGSVYAHLRGMNDGERLSFANAAARLYVRADSPAPPTEREVLAALG